MNIKLQSKLTELPVSPGIYFHKSVNGEIIYIGKAAVLKNRVRQYFQNSRSQDLKTQALVAEIDNVDWIETESEIDALFLEAEMVKRYMPRYNILLRDDKSQIFVRIDMKSDWPHIEFTRNPADDGAEYYGPYYNGFAVKKALRYLRRVFPYYTEKPRESSRPDLYVHLGLSPDSMTSQEYKSSLRKLVGYIKGDRLRITRELEKEMKMAASEHEYEKAAELRNKIYNLKELQRRIMFGDKEFLDISKDEALVDLKELFGLKKIPVRIEGFDISHISGTDVVGSMVVFSNGVSNRAQYRKFKTFIDKNDDFHNIREVIGRRFSEKNIKDWGRPDLVLIDGGKGQLDSAIRARDSRGHSMIPFVGLAKKEELIIIQKGKGVDINNQKIVQFGGAVIHSKNFSEISLPKTSHVVKLLQRIRDESHRFAVSYHSQIHKKNQTSGVLDGINGIGPKTRTKLIRKFGSIKAVSAASHVELADLVGISKAKLVFEHLKSYNPR